MTTKKRRVLIVCENPLFASGLQQLLQQEGAVETLGVLAEGEELLAMISTLRPDVILAEVDMTKPDPGMLLSLLMETHGEARVVGVSFTRNEAILYTGRRWTAIGMEDLMPSILGLNPTPN